MSQIEVENIIMDLYLSNRDVRDYIDKYTESRGLSSCAEAFKHKMVQEYVLYVLAEQD